LTTSERTAAAAPGEDRRPVDDASALGLALGKGAQAVEAAPVIHHHEGRLAGVRNQGLFATHELEYGVPRRADWGGAGEKAGSLLNGRGRPLLDSLGFTLEPLAAGPGSILLAGGRRFALAVFPERNQPPAAPSKRFSNLSPVSYALATADKEGLPYVVVCAGSLIRLYPARVGVGVGQRARTETYVEIDLELLDRKDAGYLWLLFSAAALRSGGTVEDILARSHGYAAELGERLRERIYGEIIPRLAKALLRARGLKNPGAADLSQIYQMALTLLFRLLFVAYAEDKELLPYRTNEFYRRRSLEQKAGRMLELVRKAKSIAEIQPGEGFGLGTSLWNEIELLFRAVDKGNSRWGVPSYNGRLFSTDRALSPIGHALKSVRLSNEEFGPVLAGLLLDPDTPEGWGPVDFRSLSVREFGTVYEGLLENELSMAPADLAVTPRGVYRLARGKDKVTVPTGQLYPHTPSGVRKSTGTYFTKHFAVEHLLDHALEPALAEHLARLDGLDDRAAADAFFDFRVADIAMGSGHFLVAAVDRIERALSGYLAKRSLVGVAAELERLRAAARAVLGRLADGVEIEGTQLLRRQIARRCIYGVDLNRMAVELARLSIRIHTFVPGLPLSFLDHNLVEGNSLVGIATIAEAEETIKQMAGPPYALSSEELIGMARDALSKLARACDANAGEIEAARRAAEEAYEAVKPAQAMFDILAAARIDEDVRAAVKREASHWKSRLASLPRSAARKMARDVLGAVRPLHFPIAFPEVFLSERPGFDVILGNPPWEEATVEEDRFWTRYDPGLHALLQGRQEAAKKKFRRVRPDLVRLYRDEREKAQLLRRVLTSGPFPGMGSGDPDVYKAFAWRFWNLAAAQGGRIGVVLPRSAFAARGSEPFRQELFANGSASDVTFLSNRGGWVFDDAEHRYTIALASLRRGTNGNAEIPLRGPFASYVSYAKAMERQPLCFPVKEVLSWTDTAALPLLPDDKSGAIFAQLRRAPRLDRNAANSWRARPYRELDATNDKKLMRLGEKSPDGFWPVFKGESFDVWVNDTGSYYGWADPDKVIPALQQKRQRSSKLARSPFAGFPPTWLQDCKTLPCWSARIAVRDVTNRTNRRTVIAALVPPKVLVTNKAPYFLWPSGDERDQAFLLAVLCSIPLDWYARRFVEVSLNYHVLNPMPVPRPSRDDPLWQRAVALGGRLACLDMRLRIWAEAVGVDCGPLAQDLKQDMIHELDAVVAHLCALSESQLGHIFETFHAGWDYADRLKATLKHFHGWEKKR
jgi:Eco57I restriction-modification methylase